MNFKYKSFSAVYYNSVHPDNRKDTIDTDKYPGSLGTTLELCAGIVDKNKSLLEIAREEALEECGYDIPAEKMEEIATCRSGVGEQSALFTVYFCEVTDDMKTGAGELKKFGQGLIVASKYIYFNNFIILS